MKKAAFLKDHELPPIMREIVGNAPKSRKIACFVASAAALSAMSSRVRLHYFYDTRPSALLLQVLIEGAQSSGKSFCRRHRRTHHERYPQSTRQGHASVGAGVSRQEEAP